MNTNKPETEFEKYQMAMKAVAHAKRTISYQNPGRIQLAAYHLDFSGRKLPTGLQ